jgi:hypothetical protein
VAGEPGRYAEQNLPCLAFVSHLDELAGPGQLFCELLLELGIVGTAAGEGHQKAEREEELGEAVHDGRLSFPQKAEHLRREIGHDHIDIHCPGSEQCLF